MNELYKNAIMFLGSSKGLSLIYIFIYTIYYVRKTGRYICFLWILLPIIPIVHFFSTKKSRTIWIIFIIMMTLYIYVALNIEPNIADKKILKVDFLYDNSIYTINGDEHPELLTDIKWEVYKAELLWNLGVKKDNGFPQGKLIIYLNGVTLTRNFSINRILQIIKKGQIEEVGQIEGAFL